MLKMLVDLTRILQLLGRRAVSLIQRKQLMLRITKEEKEQAPIITYKGKMQGWPRRACGAIWGHLVRNVRFGVKCAELMQYANNLKQQRALRVALINAFCPPPKP